MKRPTTQQPASAKPPAKKAARARTSQAVTAANRTKKPRTLPAPGPVTPAAGTGGAKLPPTWGRVDTNVPMADAFFGIFGMQAVNPSDLIRDNRKLKEQVKYYIRYIVDLRAQFAALKPVITSIGGKNTNAMRAEVNAPGEYE